jgi:hypothetical protein
MSDPLSAQCPACLAAPGEQCNATSSDLPREHLHRLRSLTGAERLNRCGACNGSGWERSGRGPVTPEVTICPVCDALPYNACIESGQQRPGPHLVRVRAAQRGVEPCGACKGVGWKSQRREVPGDV